MKFLKNLDYFSQNIFFSYKEKEKFRTYFGAIITIFIYVFAIISFTYFSSDLINKKNPKINISNKEFGSKEVKFSENDIYIAIALYSDMVDTGEFIDETIFNVNARYYYNNNSIKDGPTHNSVNLNLQVCDEDTIPKNKFTQDYFKSKNISSFFCFTSQEYKKLAVVGEYEDNYYQKLIFDISRCKNTTNSSKCSSNEKMDYILKETWMEIYLIYKNENINDYKNPFEYTSKYKEFFFTNKEKKFIDMKFRYVDIESDDGFLFPNIHTKTMAILDSISDSTHYRSDEFMVKFDIQYIKSSKKIKRVYEKIPKIIAEVGGILNFLFVCVFIFFKPLNKLFLILEVINSNIFVSIQEKALENIRECQLITKNKLSFENSNPQLEGKINKIEISTSPPIMSKNYESKILMKIRTSFCTLAKTYLSKKFKFLQNKRDNILKSAISNFREKTDFNSFLKLYDEFEVIKYLLFNEDQTKLIENHPLCIFQYQEKINRKKKINFEESFQKILEKQNKTEIDKKLVSMFSYKKIIY